MRKIILTFGLISGAISSFLMAATVPFEHEIGYDHAMVVGYTIIVLSFLLVFFGVKSYRDNLSAGRITFGKAFGVGISITLISCLCYVVTWEVMYFKFLPGFMDKYTAHVVEKAKASGASAAEIAERQRQMEKYREMYDNPLTNAAMTFIEPFPVGLVITLVSAAVLRRKTEVPQQQVLATKNAGA